MSTTIITDSIISNNEFIGNLNNLWFLSPNKISTLKQIIEFTTDEESSLESKEFLDFCILLKNDLASTHESNIEEYSAKLALTKKIIGTVDSFLDLIKNVFEKDYSVPTEFIIDDPYMPVLMDNLNKGKDILHYISDYLSLSIDVQTAKDQFKNGEFEEYSISELIYLIKAA